MSNRFTEAVRVAGEVVKNAVVGQCRFENNTKYKVEIIDHDGTRTLNPGETQGNYLVKGFSVDLVMKFRHKGSEDQFPRKQVRKPHAPNEHDLRR